MNIEEELNSIKRYKVLVVGDIMIDKYIFGTTKRISQEAPIPILNTDYEKNILGGAANVAYNLKRADQDVSVLTVIGKDANAELLTNLLNEMNIETNLIIKDASRVTTLKTRFIGQNKAQMLRVDNEDTTPISEDISSLLVLKLKQNIDKFDLVIISDYCKGVLTTQNTPELIKIANDANVKVLVDVKEPNYEKYKNAYLIKPNLIELAQITRMPVSNEDEIEMAAMQLLRNTNAKYVLATRGKDGMTLFSDNKKFHVNAILEEVFDVTGAGDTVISYLAVSILNNLDIDNAVKISNYAAGVKVTKLGSYGVTVEDIKNYILKDRNTTNNKKILSIDELTEILKNNDKNNKIVFTNGCFDILHIGHIRYLKEAAKYGDIFIVGVNSDASVKKLKGESRPIVPEEDRMEMLAALDFVSYIVKFEEETPYEIIKKIKPFYIVKGGDYKKENIVGLDIVQSYGGDVIVLPYLKNRSTTNIIRKIEETFKK